MQQAETHLTGARREPASEREDSAAEPQAEYLVERPALVLTFLDIAEQYWDADTRRHN